MAVRVVPNLVVIKMELLPGDNLQDFLDKSYAQLPIWVFETHQSAHFTTDILTDPSGDRFIYYSPTSDEPNQLYRVDSSGEVWVFWAQGEGRVELADRPSIWDISFPMPGEE